MLLMLTSFGVQKYKLGDPTTTDVNLGPVCSVASAERIRKQIADAVKAGAKALIPEDLFPAAQPYVKFAALHFIHDLWLTKLVEGPHMLLLKCWLMLTIVSSSLLADMGKMAKQKLIRS